MALSLGVAGAGTGAALLALDGREHGPTCGPARIDVNGACPNVYTTGPAGYVGLGLGVAAAAVGIGLLIHDGRQRSKRARAQVTSTGLRISF